MTYILRVLIAIDQLVNALINGDPKQTLSSAAYRAERDGRFWGFTRKIIDALFYLVQSNHCYCAYLEEKHAAKNFRSYE